MKNIIVIAAIAAICHEANRAYCATIGDNTQKSWDDAEQWQRDSAVKGVQFTVDNPNAPASAQHDAWTADKVSQGWEYGLVKDASAKTHPCIVPYDMLPAQQRAKDSLFQGIVKSLLPGAEEVFGV